jgi:DNA polymerase III epsilon subunit-like protein
MSNSNIIIVFDTETTGFSPEKNEIVQLSYILYDTQTQTVVYATTQGDDIVNIKGKIPPETTAVHGISKDMTLDKRFIKEHIDQFIQYCTQAGKFVGHNIKFDIKMISGQIKKIITEFPEDKERYDNFLNSFDMVGKKLPEAAYCTMSESQGICAQLKGTKKLKNEKLMEVHKLLFNQDVGGQLHNALVDISVTLRIYLKLTMNIDICQSMTQFTPNVVNVSNNVEICSLINPIGISGPIENVEYSGELITGLTRVPSGLEEETINVETVVKKMATKLASEFQAQAMTNVLGKIQPTTTCTSISICKSIIVDGNETNQTCDRYSNNEFCSVEGDVRIKPQKKSGFFSKKSKVIPLGGQKKKTKRRKNKRTIKKRKSYK